MDIVTEEDAGNIIRGDPIPQRTGDPSVPYYPDQGRVEDVGGQADDWPMMAESARAVPRGAANVASDIFAISAATVPGGLMRAVYNTGDAELASMVTELTGLDALSAGNIYSTDPRERAAAMLMSDQDRDAVIEEINKASQIDQESVGWIEDFENVKSDAFNWINKGAEALGFSLHPNEENLEQLSSGQKRVVAGIEGAVAVGLPLTGAAKAGIAGVKAGAAIAKGGKAAAQQAASAGGKAIKSGLKNKANLMYGGAIGGTGLGAAVTESDSSTEAGELADYTEGAAQGGLVGLLSGAGVRLVKQLAAGQQAGRVKDAFKSISQWHQDIDKSKKLLGEAGLEHVPLAAGVSGDSVFGRAWRHGASELSAADQRRFNYEIANAQRVLEKKQSGMRGDFGSKMGGVPEPLGHSRRVNVDDQSVSVDAMIDRSKKNLRRSQKLLGDRYERANKSFDEISVKGFKGKFVSEGTQRSIEDLLQVGDELEADILGKVARTRTSQTTDPFHAKGGFRRLLDSIKENVKQGRTKDGMPASVVTNFVHNANEVLRKAEQSGDPAFQSRARELVDYAYGLMDKLVDQGLLPKRLVSRFRGLQADAQEHYRKFYGPNAIAEVLKEQKLYSPMERMTKVRSALMTRGGNLREDNIKALYDTTGDSDMVDSFIADTINTKYDSATDMLGFYNKNSFVLGAETYSGLRAKMDDILFNKMSIQLGDQGDDILDFVRKMPDRQIGDFTKVVLDNGTDAYRYMGYRVLDEIAAMPLAQRMKYIQKNQRKLERMLGTKIGGKPEMLDALGRMNTFNAVEVALKSHRPFDVAEPTGLMSHASDKIGKVTMDTFGLPPVMLASAGRAVVRRILSVSTAYVGLILPRQARYMTNKAAQKYFLRTLHTEMSRSADLEAALLESVSKGKITDELHTFLKAMAYNMGQSAYQPSRFSQDRMGQIEREKEAHADRLLGVQ